MKDSSFRAGVTLHEREADVLAHPGSFSVTRRTASFIHGDTGGGRPWHHGARRAG
jgi:hypothetical protein